MITLPARHQGALGLPTVKVIGVSSEDCLEWMAAHNLEFVPNGQYSASGYDTVHTPFAALEQAQP